ncbi:MAG: helix-turn-helix domain-containing protein [Pseudobutyrivibrio sp.]|nr:helix-turn-helix domain-containing protein [Pseudobutyrivibrio sp.]
MDTELNHYGTPQRYDGDPNGSGRYRKGSGENPYQHGASESISERAKELKNAGMTEAEIAKALGMSTTQLRARKSIEKQEQIARETAQALRLKDKGYSVSTIASIMGLPERTVYSRLDPTLKDRANRTASLAEQLKAQVDEKTYLDVGSGVELQLGVPRTQLQTAISMLEEQGYKKHYLRIEQATNPGKYTSVLVLTKDDIPYKQVYDHRDKIMSPDGIYSEDGGRTWSSIKEPISIDSDRISINYAETGGAQKDGVIELRRGVEDISLGQSQYAQVRIAVDGTHYLKGMAIYSDSLPPGVDILFNTNKHEGTPLISANKDDPQVLKPMKADKDNPFGSTVRQYNYIGKDGLEHQSAINIVNDDSDWEKWSKNLSSQFLSKQNVQLAKRQLDLAYKEKKQEYEDICSLTNPAVKKTLLLSFSEQCDSDAVHLKAAAMPRQQSQVILPITSLKDNEVYAPNFKPGEEVILVRYPHGGIFEIPRLKVNNNNPEGKSILGNADNAIGINANVAAKLSGADFDGDTVIVIPTKNQNLKTSPSLKALKDFDPKERYPAYEGMPPVSEKTGFRKQMEMGKVSNLITDMTLRGASEEDIARAVRHSMVVIDAEKHNLNWRQSYEDNGIAQLKEKYQGGKNKGASTLISKASSEYDIPMRSDWIPVKATKPGQQGIDPETGRKIFKETGETWTDKKGKVKLRTEKSTKMAETHDAYSLSSGTRMESVYADHANKLKALANEARKEYISTPNQNYSPAAKKTYSSEVESLDRKLKTSLLNAPRERQAQLLADSIFRAKKKSNPGMTNEEEKKLKTQTIKECRSRVSAISRKDRNISITDREWEAIQAGAISNNKLTQILRNADEKDIKERATPRNKPAMTAAKISRAKAMVNAGYSQAEVAESLGVSISTLRRSISS